MRNLIRRLWLRLGIKIIYRSHRFEAMKYPPRECIWWGCDSLWDGHVGPVRLCNEHHPEEVSRGEQQ
jgi:hypothetical protein